MFLRERIEIGTISEFIEFNHKQKMYLYNKSKDKSYLIHTSIQAYNKNDESTKKYLVSN